MRLPVLIPAYKPDETLIKLVNELIHNDVLDIIIINDGSGPEYTAIFDSLAKVKQCHILHHSVNLGKGRAIKTGLNYFYLTFKDSAGIITADADGQHLVKDIVNVTEKFLTNPHALVIGSRSFHKGTPLRNRFGNIITRYVFWALIGKKIVDTQSGLRCIPRHAVPTFLRLEGEKYDYEMNMLISTKHLGIDVTEVTISTIYIGNNTSSHFNPLIDSMKIYFLLLRFSFSSLFASVIDFVVFGIVYHFTANILTSIIFARLLSGNINFFVNKSLVFHSKRNIVNTIVKYYVLFISIGGIAYISIRTLSEFGVPVMLSKILVETFLFITSFSIQREFIFSHKHGTK